jgi:hypothetical protein
MLTMIAESEKDLALRLLGGTDVGYAKLTRRDAPSYSGAFSNSPKAVQSNLQMRPPNWLHSGGRPTLRTSFTTPRACGTGRIRSPP